ncbi:hypothetical protein J1605_014962 [Eschrichtius robustus]|uniref:KH-like RNA-binding domain-containing protein n=1 Tax=Eschrichtius robustus TaxID=9764 RepID=A0AB34GF31_ESCRO|nr:hypothetical protein J1605_014962 [Eschrichtius robustus]
MSQSRWEPESTRRQLGPPALGSRRWAGKRPRQSTGDQGGAGRAGRGECGIALPGRGRGLDGAGRGLDGGWPGARGVARPGPDGSRIPFVEQVSKVMLQMKGLETSDLAEVMVYGSYLCKFQTKWMLQSVA